MDPKFVPSKAVSMRSGGIDERALQKLIADDPSVLGLGELDLRDYERAQPAGGRLDLLLFDPDSDTRFEVELQLGATDPSHIIRCIEYWDEERRRFPQYNHVAVLVAEDITSRFFNVISLFNRAIPIIAIQATLLAVGDAVTLTFTKVLDLTTLGTEEEDERGSVVTDRTYWVERSSEQALAVVNQILVLARETDADPGLELNYNAHYIGLRRRGKSDNYLSFNPRKSGFAIVRIVIPQSTELTKQIDDEGFDQMSYNNHYNQYGLRITDRDLTERADGLRHLIQLAQAHRSIDAE